MKIRIATKNDVKAIANLHSESWRFAYRGALSDEYLAGDIFSDRERLWTERLSTTDQKQYIVIAEDNTKLIGFACALVQEDPVQGTLIDNIHVLKSHHRNGIGALLMRQIANWHMQKYPTSPLFLWVLQSNIIAQQFYKALGAANVGVDIWLPPGGGAVSRFRYAWSNVEKLL